MSFYYFKCIYFTSSNFFPDNESTTFLRSASLTSASTSFKTFLTSSAAIYIIYLNLLGLAFPPNTNKQ